MLNEIFKGIVNYCRENEENLEEIECRDNSVSFYDYSTDSNLVFNDMTKLSFEDIIHKNNIYSYIEKSSFIKKIEKINPILLLGVNEIVFVCSEEDIKYLEDNYCVELLDKCLGQYNYEHNVIVINFRHILHCCTEILKIEGRLLPYTLNDFVSEEIIVTLIHELAHCFTANNYLAQCLIPELNDCEDNDEEKVVENYARYIIEDFFPMYSLNSEFVLNYLECPNSYFNDEIESEYNEFLVQY